MPFPTILMRTLLIFVLCANGMANAWASTSMAVQQAGHSKGDAAGDHGAAKAAADCDTKRTVADASVEKSAAKPAGEQQAAHDACDCTSQACCDCVLTFFTVDGDTLFAAQHSLSVRYLALQPVQPVLGDLSPVFRPPIG